MLIDQKNANGGNWNSEKIQANTEAIEQADRQPIRTAAAP
jgi:hypothetical protein